VEVYPLDGGGGGGVSGVGGGGGGGGEVGVDEAARMAEAAALDEEVVVMDEEAAASEEKVGVMDTGGGRSGVGDGGGGGRGSGRLKTRLISVDAFMLSESRLILASTGGANDVFRSMREMKQRRGQRRRGAAAGAYTRPLLSST
jgi:hypothetical protein